VWNRDWGKMNADCDKFASCKTTPFSGALGYVQLFTATTSPHFSKNSATPRA
jgi:hypothetical protein